MKILGNMHQKRDGFTITELLIVITVIGILVSIALIVYPGYKERARDAERKSDIGQVAAAISAYAVQKNNFVGTGSGCGLNGNGNGWLNAGLAQIGTYPRSIIECLQDADVLKQADFIDPSGCIWGSGGACGTSGGQPSKAYMKATCQKGGATVTYVYAHIESQPRQDSVIDALCDNDTMSGFTTITQKWGTNHGMNYYVTVQ